MRISGTIAEVSGAKVVIGSLFRRQRPRMPDEIYEEIRDAVNFWSVFCFFSRATPAVRFSGLYHFFRDDVHLAEAEDQELFYRSVRGAILFHGR